MSSRVARVREAVTGPSLRRPVVEPASMRTSGWRREHSAHRVSGQFSSHKFSSSKLPLFFTTCVTFPFCVLFGSFLFLSLSVCVLAGWGVLRLKTLLQVPLFGKPSFPLPSNFSTLAIKLAHFKSGSLQPPSSVSVRRRTSTWSAWWRVCP